MKKELFLDEFYNRYFYSTMDEIERALFTYSDLPEFYESLGLSYNLYLKAPEDMLKLENAGIEISDPKPLDDGLTYRVIAPSNVVALLRAFS